MGRAREQARALEVLGLASFTKSKASPLRFPRLPSLTRSRCSCLSHPSQPTNVPAAPTVFPQAYASTLVSTRLALKEIRDAEEVLANITRDRDILCVTASSGCMRRPPVLAH